MLKIEGITLDPALLARAFWNLSDYEQAEFFEKLHDMLEKDDNLFLSDMQWYSMGKCINKNEKAKHMACRMLVYIFNHATDYLNRDINV